MAAHFLRLKKYHPPGYFEKDLKALHLEELMLDDV
jgi:hypothetical protein